MTPKLSRRRQTDKVWVSPSKTSRAAIDADLDAGELAVRRTGRTREERLRWVVSEFARKDLDVLRPEELVALGYDLRQLMSPPWGTRRPHGPLPGEVVRRVQRDVKNGLRALLNERRSPATRGWDLPAGTDRLIRWSAPGSKKATFALRSSGDEYTVIMRGVAHLVINAGAGLRACKECQSPFLAVKRQEYCEPTCGQRARDRRKKRERENRRERNSN